MEEGWHVIPVEDAARSRFVQSLWSPTLGEDPEIEDDDLENHEEVAAFETEEGPGTAKLSYSTRTQSRITPPEHSNSGRVYQNLSLCQAEFSRPTMNIRSRVCVLRSSQNPLPPQRAPSLTSWIPTANYLRLPPPSKSSPSPRAERTLSRQRRLTG